MSNPATLVKHNRANQPVRDAMLARQDAFLEAFRKHGTIRKGYTLAAISRETVRRWINEDVFGFAARYRDAHDDWVDSQEELLNKMNAGLKPGQTPIGLLASLNASRPDKWSRNVQVTHEVGQAVLATLQKIQEQQPAPSLPEAKPDKPWVIEGNCKTVEKEG